MTIANFDRDLLFLDVANSLDLPAASATSGDPTARTDGMLHTAFAALHVPFNSLTFTNNNRRVVGVLMLPPPVDRRSVYRVKGCGLGYSADLQVELLVGIGPAAPTGSDVIEQIALVQGFRMGAGCRFDEAVALDNFGIIAATDYSERPVFFGMSVLVTGGANISSTFSGCLSVQNLAVKNPPYEAAVR